MITIGQFFGRVNSRQVFSAYGGLGTDVAPWKCSAIGDESAVFPVTQADVDAVGIFAMVPTPNPVGFSPYGDLVDFRSNAVGFNQLGSVATSSKTLTTERAIVAGWLAYEVAPTFKLAVIVLRVDGVDRYVFALPEEITMVEKNAHFP